MNKLTLGDARTEDAVTLAHLITAAYLGQWTTSAQTVTKRLTTTRTGGFSLSARNGGGVVAGLDADRFVTAPDGLRLQFYGDPAAFTPLYLEALTRAHSLAYRSLLSVVRQDHRPQVEFLAAAGFRNAYQSWGAHLDLRRFDFAPYLPLEQRHYLDGTEIRRYAPGSREAPWEALHALYVQGRRDTPKNPTTTHDSDSPEYFRTEVAAGQVFAAVRRGEVLSYTALGLNSGTVLGLNPGTVDSEHTATRADCRGQGLGTLVKATALNWARGAGYAAASTGGNVANLPMLRVNQRLGYLPEPMWLTWVRDLPTPPASDISVSDISVSDISVSGATSTGATSPA
jgi:mycothiol synthase